MRKRFLIAGITAGLLAGTARAEVRVAGIFGDHLVLQRGISVPVWGSAQPGEKVSVAFGGQEKETVAGPDGRWLVRLDPMPASKEGRSLVVSGENTRTLSDVLVGDVWLCSGQSNMAMKLGQCDRPEDIAGARFPLIRHFEVPEPRENPSGPSRELAAHTWWTVCSPETAPRFTGVGFYFARRIHQETGVPIGLVLAARGGTRIEVWLSPEGVAAVPELAGKLREPEKGKPGENQFIHVLYNGMIHPLIPLAIKGLVWYQGESNAGDGGALYDFKMKALIDGWRKLWRQGDFPVYFVQIPSIGGPDQRPESRSPTAVLAPLREAQRRSLSIPRTGMAVTIECNTDREIGYHPRNKLDVGERLALWALKYDYGRTGIECSGPLLKEMRIEGDKIRVSFDHADSGLMVGEKKEREPTREVQNGRLQQFAIAGPDGRWAWAEAAIEGKTVVVSSADVPQPVAVRYAYSGHPAGCNLYNREGLPASPFEAGTVNGSSPAPTAGRNQAITGKNP